VTVHAHSWAFFPISRRSTKHRSTRAFVALWSSLRVAAARDAKAYLRAAATLEPCPPSLPCSGRTMPGAVCRSTHDTTEAPIAKNAMGGAGRGGRRRRRRGRRREDGERGGGPVGGRCPGKVGDEG